jgi:hypothetical protein
MDSPDCVAIDFLWEIFFLGDWLRKETDGSEPCSQRRQCHTPRVNSDTLPEATRAHSQRHCRLPEATVPHSQRRQCHTPTGNSGTLPELTRAHSQRHCRLPEATVPHSQRRQWHTPRVDKGTLSPCPLSVDCRCVSARALAGESTVSCRLQGLVGGSTLSPCPLVPLERERSRRDVQGVRRHVRRNAAQTQRNLRIGWVTRRSPWGTTAPRPALGVAVLS